MSARSTLSSVRMRTLVLAPLSDVFHLELHEGAPTSANVHVVGFGHAPQALFLLDQIAHADLGCQDFSHTLVRIKKKAAFQ